MISSPYCAISDCSVYVNLEAAILLVCAQESRPLG